MKNKAIIYLILMLFATAFASCTDENFLAEELSGTKLAESQAVKIAVTETDWQGQTVSLTRAGETLEQLKASSERTWDFTKTPLMDLGVLKADAAKTVGAKWTNVDKNSDGVGDDKQFQSKEALSGALLANGVELYMTDGLSFSGFTGEEDDLRIDVDKQLLLSRSGLCITLPSLKKGQEVTVEFSTAADGKSRNLVPGGSVDSATPVASTSTSTHAQCTIKMTADGSPTFTVGTGTGGSAVYIYSISVTRAESDGFGLFSDSKRLKVINSHIIWDSDIQSWKGISDDAYLMLWPNNILKCNIAFNEEAVQSKSGYYTLSGPNNFNSQFTGCTYDGITFTQGLNMEEGTTISFEIGTVGGTQSTVTIVQSDWQSNETPHGTPATIKLDDVVLDVASAAEIPGGRVYVLRNVLSGTHTITRGSGESGIFYVAVDIPFTAYAPYIADKNLATDADDDSYGIVSRNMNNLVFQPHKDNRIDLMYAEHRTSIDGVVELNFKHALGKLSIGTIYNDYGENITLEEIKLTSRKYYTKGTLSLATGEWSGQVVNDNYLETYNSTLLAALFGSLVIPDKGSLTFPKDVAYTQIPGTVMTFEYKFKADISNTEFTVTMTIEIEKGENKYVNITIGQNHEVVIE